MRWTTGEESHGSRLAGVKRVASVLVITLAVVASLLAFPAGIVVMTACWLAAYTLGVVRSRRSSWLLAVWIAVVLIKRIDWPPTLWGLMLLAGAAVATSMGRGNLARRMPPVLAPALLWLAWVGFAIDSYRAVHINHIPTASRRQPIVCVGDSLTSYTRQGGYPEILADMVAVPVINLGQPGITSAEALKKLPELKAARPCVVVIELGGHDFLKDTSLLKRTSRVAVKRNLEAFIAAAHELGAEVVLIEVPRGFIVDPFAGLERELARQYDLELVSDTIIRRFVLASPIAPLGMWLGGPQLSDDGLHPNSEGNALLARQVLAAVRRISIVTKK
ncbi:MAG TPA: GDSL-type esterase/lipase family protein [Pirellulales bacterium]|nr:GDSL-type esterase/lipase family protein [Pirellulales bacterium]